MARSRLLWLPVAALTVLAASGCGGSSGKGAASGSSSASSSTSTSSNNTQSSGAAFCAALVTLAEASTSDVDPNEALDQVDANAPAELKDDIADFVANARAVTAAFSAAGGASASSIDTESVLAQLTPEQQQFAKDLAAAAGSGTISDTSSGHVIKYFIDHCGAASAPSSFSSVGSVVN